MTSTPHTANRAAKAASLAIAISLALGAALMPIAASAAPSAPNSAADANTPAAASAATASAKPPAKAEPRARAEESVSFNFVDVDITVVAKFISEVTGKNFIFDERVSGKVTVVAPTKLRASDAYNLFTSVLEMKGYALIPSGVNAYKIVSATDAKQSGLRITERKPVNEDYIIQLIPVENISSDEALKFLQPVVSKSGYISSFGPGNMLLVIDSGLNIQKIQNILSAIDQPVAYEEPDIVYMNYSAAENMAAVLNEGIQKSNIRKKGGTAAASTTTRAVADTRLNAVVLFGSKSEKEAMKRLVELLDVKAKQEQGVINVYFLENADAEELAKVLQGILDRSAASASATKSKAPSSPGAAPSAVSYSGTPFSSGTISITPDKLTNSLVIVASPSDYTSLASVVKQLDKRRKQVFVEAMIVEASLDNLRELGAKWHGTVGSYDGSPLAIGGFGTMDTTAMQSILTGLSGMTAGGMGNFMDISYTDSTGTTQTMTIPGYAALFSANEFNGTVNVLSSPQILTTDNTEAEIVVGENVPFITKTETVAGSTTSTKSIERKDVGISLKLTPQITEGDFVRLDLYQEISSVKDSSETIYTEVGPTTTKRSTKTSVVVRDKQTVVISGLMQETVTEDETRVPLLHRIPLLGWLFKYRTTNKLKTNLLVFLTPHIIKDASDMDRLTTDKQTEYSRREDQFATDELLVMFKPDTKEERALEIVAEEKAKVIKKLGETLYYLKLRPGRNVKGAASDFADYKEVEYAEPNYRVKAFGEDK